VQRERNWSERETGAREKLERERNWSERETGSREKLDRERNWSERETGAREKLERERNWSERETGAREKLERERIRSRILMTCPDGQVIRIQGSGNGAFKKTRRNSDDLRRAFFFPFVETTRSALTLFSLILSRGVGTFAGEKEKKCELEPFFSHLPHPDLLISAAHLGSR